MKDHPIYKAAYKLWRNYPQAMIEKDRATIEERFPLHPDLPIFIAVLDRILKERSDVGTLR